jgi:proline dehydrogenase
MLRRLLLYLSNAGWARTFVTQFFLARRVARRFVAGETLAEALDVTRDLNARGLLVSLDYLGESVTEAADTEAIVATYRELLEHIHTRGLDASISLKLTHLGLDINEDLCVTNLRHILTDARAHDIRVTLDMESSAYTDRTLRIYRTMRDEYDFDNIGTVIQSALKRSQADMHELAAEGARIRLCKGAYLEPPSVAYEQKAAVDASYRQIMVDYFQHTPPAILEVATHDETIIQQAQAHLHKQDVPTTHYEFQMLYGVRGSRQVELAGMGHRVRVYVPFGEAWYPYFMRRLAERPANLWFFLRSLISG